MKAYVGVTDFDWYELLASGSGLDEVNFWQPGGSRRFQAVEPEELPGRGSGRAGKPCADADQEVAEGGLQDLGKLGPGARLQAPAEEAHPLRAARERADVLDHDLAGSIRFGRTQLDLGGPPPLCATTAPAAAPSCSTDHRRGRPDRRRRSR